MSTNPDGTSNDLTWATLRTLPSGYLRAKFAPTALIAVGLSGLFAIAIATRLMVLDPLLALGVTVMVVLGVSFSVLAAFITIEEDVWAGRIKPKDRR